MSRPEVVGVLVAWNSAEHLGRAVSSFPADTPVVVVDNASTDGSAEVAEQAGATVIRSPRNLGFGPACNLGARSRDSRAILFLNPDAALLDGERAIPALLAALSEPGVGAVAPALVGDGQDVFQLRRLPTLSSLAREALLVNRLLPGNAGLRHERYLDLDRGAPFDVEQPAAAALLVRRDVFEALGGFDDRFFPAWFEDVDLCARILAAGHRIRFVPGARASHVGGTTMRALPYRDFLPLYTRNLFRYLARHASSSTRLLARILLLAGTLLRLALLPVVKGDHARGDAARAYVRVLRGLLGLGYRTSLDATMRN